MQPPVKICVVGLGRISKSHLAGMREIPEAVQIAAIVSSDPDKRKMVSSEYSIPKTYASLDEALKDPEIEAMDLCLPNHVHREIAVRCAEAGKHILVEKPMANTVGDCEKMIRAANKAGVRLMVG